MTKRVPEIRFEGFTDDWEQRKLGDVVKNIGTGNSKFQIQEKSNDASYAILGSTSVIGYDNNFDFEGNFVLTARVGANAGTLYQHSGKVKISDNTVYIQSDNLSFLYNLLNRFDLKKLSFGTGQPLVKSSELKKLALNFPNEEEQKKIGIFFEQLDDTIALHQRKLEQLQSMKNGFLQKMFPKDGEKEPEIRFPGFADDWEQRKLGDIYKKIRNAFVGTATPYYVEEGNFYLESNNIKDGNINRKTEVFINDEFYEKQKDKWLKTGDLVMVQSGHVGHTAVIPEELNNTAAHALIMFQEQKRKTNPYFLNYQFLTDRSKRKLDMITTGNTIKHILASEMKNFEVFVCENDEENLIADFFKKLDDTIALHQRELELLKQTKKAFLQKMFV